MESDVVENKHFSAALDMLDEMLLRDVPLNSYTFTVAINDAARLLENLWDEELCMPNEVTFLAVINGMCRAGLTAMALELVVLFEEDERCKLDVFAYNAVIHGLCKEGMMDDADKDVFAYNSMILGLCNSCRCSGGCKISSKGMSKL